MSAGWLVAIVLGIGVLAYFFSAQRARAQRDQVDRSKEVPHSLPLYHGWFAFLLSTLPPIIVLVVLSAFSSGLIEGRIRAEAGTHIPDPAAASLQVGIIHNAAEALARLGLTGTGVPSTYAALRDAACETQSSSRLWQVIVGGWKTQEQNLHL